MANIPFLNNAYFAAKVGIGTASPGNTLHVYKNATIGVITSPTVANAGFRVQDSGANMYVDGNSFVLDSTGYLTTTGSNDFDIGTNSTSRIKIKGSGNVGIGTTSPQYPLHVAGSSSVSAPTGNGVLMGLYAGTYGHIQMNGSSGSYIDFSQSGVDHKGRILYDNGSNYLRLDTNGTEKMRINSGGTVLINASAPRESASKLSVQGGMSEFETTLTNNDDWQNSPISILERANIGSGSTADKYAPNLNFHWGGVTSKSLWMGANGHLSFGEYSSTGVPSTNGTFKAGNLVAASAITGNTGTFTGLVSGITPVAAANFVTKAYADGLTPGAGVFLPLAGGTMTGNTKHNDDVFSYWGNSDDLSIQHNNSGQFAQMKNYTGDLYFTNTADDKDIIFQADNSTNGTETYLTIDGSNRSILVTAPLGVYHNDGVAARFGDIGDLQIYHSGNDSYIQDGGTGNLLITSNGASVQINKGTTENMAEFIVDGPVRLYDDSNKKLETRIVGVGTATTAGGTLIDGWKTTTQANAINDTTIATTAYVNNKIGLIPAGLQFEGTWDASTGNPPSASPENGQFWIVSVAGSTSLSGITDWKVGDWAIYVVAGSGTDGWQKVDNSSVLDGSGTGQSVTKWDGSGTSNTLTDGPITFSSNDSTFAGDLYIPNKIIHVGDEDTWMQFETNVISLRTGGTDRLTLTNSAATFAGDVVSNAIVQANGFRTTTGSTDYSLLTRNSSNTAVYIQQAGSGNILDVRYGSQAAGQGTSAFAVNSSGNSTFAGSIDTTAVNIKVGSAIHGTITSSSNSLTLNARNTGHMIFQSGGSEKMRIANGGNVGIGNTGPNYKLSVSGGIEAGGVVTYSKVAGSLNTTGYAIAGLGTVFNGASAFFTFTASGGTGQYQRVVYSCAGVGTNWVVYKVIDEGTNVLDIEASATSAATIVFTFKTRSGTQAYSPRVVIQATGHSIISTYA